MKKNNVKKSVDFAHRRKNAKGLFIPGIILFVVGLAFLIILMMMADFDPQGIKRFFVGVADASLPWLVHLWGYGCVSLAIAGLILLCISIPLWVNAHKHLNPKKGKN